MNKKIKLVKQLTQTECGICCISMLCSYYGYKKSLKYFREMLDIGRDGTSLKDMVNILTKIGFKSYAYKFNIDFAKALTFPIILFTNNNHFLIVEKYNNKKGYFKIADPAVGLRKINEEELKSIASNLCIVSTPSDTFIEVVDKNDIWINYKDIINSTKFKLLAVLILSVATYLFNLAIPLSYQILIDRINNENFNILQIETILSILCILFIYIILSIIKTRKIVDLEINIDSKLANKVFKHLLKIPYKFFEVRTSGEILFRLNLLNNIRLLLSQGIIKGIINFGSIIFILAYMSYLIPIMSIVVFLILITIFIYVNIINKYILLYNQEELIKHSSVTSIYSETLNSTLSIKCMGLEETTYKNFELSYGDFLSKFKKRSLLTNYNSVFLSSIQLVIPLVIFIANISFYQGGLISLGQLVAYYTLTNMLLSTSISFFQDYSNFKLMANTLERINDILDEDEETVNKNGISIDNIESLELKNINFAYSTISPYVLKNINLEIKAGEKVAFVGKSGSGKTTLTKIILGLYNPTQGNILINGVDKELYNGTHLKKMFSVVLQDTILFNKTIYDNICIGNDGISKEDVNEVMKISQIYDEVQKMPMKENTLISEHGRNLSGGQRQRLALARALIKKPKVLILDEATSSLDSINEANISDRLKQDGCSQIIISHRLATIINCDKIYVLDNGSIIELGNHEQLMNNKNVYYNLFVNQLGSIKGENNV